MAYLSIHFKFHLWFLRRPPKSPWKSGLNIPYIVCQFKRNPLGKREKHGKIAASKFDKFKVVN